MIHTYAERLRQTAFASGTGFWHIALWDCVGCGSITCTNAWSRGLFLGKNRFCFVFLHLKTLESLKYFFLVFLTPYSLPFSITLLMYILTVLSLYYANSFLAALYFTFFSRGSIFCSLPGSFSVKHSFPCSILFLQQQKPQQTPNISKDKFQCPPRLSTLPCPIRHVSTNLC